MHGNSSAGQHVGIYINQCVYSKPTITQGERYSGEHVLTLCMYASTPKPRACYELLSYLESVIDETS